MTTFFLFYVCLVYYRQRFLGSYSEQSKRSWFLTILFDDLRINGYKLIRMDQPMNTKTGCVCMYYKESLVVKMANISYLQECLLCEIMIYNIRGCIALIYRSPSQNNLDSQHFLINIVTLNSYLSILKALNLTLQFCLVIIMHVQDCSGLPTPAHRRVCNLMP